jgi:ActR/RegA family two-component response regulator
VLIADNSDSCSRALERALVAQGHYVRICGHGAVVEQLISESPPDVLITELRLANGPVLKLIAWIKAEHPAVRVVVHTDHGSIATAIRCARLGVDAYYPKPVSAEQLLSFEPESGALAADEAPSEPLPLDRAMWEYMNRVVEHAGTITQAARLLGLDKRSLRRMLGKHAPTS